MDADGGYLNFKECCRPLTLMRVNNRNKMAMLTGRSSL
jgi:hypothetical protein